VKRVAFLVMFTLWVGPVVSAGSAEVTGDEFNQFKKECRAAFDEPWRTIPWKISLLEAQNLAARERKPIFIWAMDGHPLGCT
jgi:hypothetical protein